jgi:phospholipid-transporting ATPase
LEALYE